MTKNEHARTVTRRALVIEAIVRLEEKARVAQRRPPDARAWGAAVTKSDPTSWV